MQLTKNDLNFILSRCPKDIVSLLWAEAGKLFLAGGFIRATLAGEKVSDVDLFGGTKEFLISTAKNLALSRKGRYHETGNAATVLAPPRLPVQFITRWLFDSPANLISSFDFTVCQAAIWAERVGEGEKERVLFRSEVADSFYPDLAARRLTYTHPKRNEDAGGSLLRIVKYLKRGYNVQAPSIAGCTARLLLAVKGVSMSEGHLTTILTGLLREVDPLLVIDGVDLVDEHETLAE